MATPEEDALVRQIMETVAAVLDAVLRDDRAVVAAHLAPESLLGVGLDLFGMDALAVPLGLAGRPQSMGLTSVQASDDMAVAEVSGRDAQDQNTSIASVFLNRSAGVWQVGDIWPVPADSDLDLDQIAEPTVLFYTGQLQLTPVADAHMDDVEALLLPALQEDGLGLHLIERAVHLWRLFRAGNGASSAPPAAWAAALHFTVLAMDEQDPDPGPIAARYGVPTESVVERFMQLISNLGFAPEGDTAPAPPPRPSGLVDLSGRPISSGRPGEDRPPRGGIILPGG